MCTEKALGLERAVLVRCFRCMLCERLTAGQMLWGRYFVLGKIDRTSSASKLHLVCLSDFKSDFTDKFDLSPEQDVNQNQIVAYS